MIKRILVVLDPDADTPVATETAFQIARRHDAELTGLALVDVTAIEGEAAGGGIGSMYFAEKLRQRLTDETREQARVLLTEFTDAADTAGVRHAGDHVGEDGPVRNLIDDMRTHDLLVAGRESHFYYADPERRTHAMSKVIEAGAAATLLVGTLPLDVRRVLVAYDGSTASAQAMQKFVHLSPFGTDITVELLHVRESGDDARRTSTALLDGAREYFRAYGYTVEETSLEGGKPADRIVEYADRQQADLVVSGAYTKTGLRRMMFGSAVTRLLQDCPSALFLYR